ncbi:MAG: hypothetical protein QI223_07105, partial [Candidatus Korarchaeota archaeon]|nr:hypothetical protein [Candidatus Korarchaeota archaeon]
AYLKDPDGISKYSIIPGFVEALRRYYLKRGMGATLALIDVELGFSAAADQSLDVSRLVDLLNFLLALDPARRRLVSGVAVGYLLGWIEDLRGARLKSVPAQVSLTGSLTRDLSEIPLYGLYLVKKKKLSLDLMSQKVEDWLRANVNGLSEVSPHRLLASARAIEARFEGLAAELRAGCGDERWLKNLSIALDLTLGAEPTPEQIDDLVRNMMAHVGLQHFTIASIFADFDGSWRLVDVRMVYMGGLFEAMDRVAAEQALSGSQATDLAVRLRREFPEDLHLLGCLCDLTPSVQTR